MNSRPAMEQLKPATAGDILAEAKQLFGQVIEAQKQSDYDKTYPLGSIWLVNVRVRLTELIEQIDDPYQAVVALNGSSMYDLSTGSYLIDRTIEWFPRFHAKRGRNVLAEDERFQESVFLLSENCRICDGRRLSSDFLWRLAIIDRIQQSITLPDTREVFFELGLGSGSGNLARAMKLHHPNATYVVCDIPESLFYAFLFLRMNFPDATYKYVTDGNQLGDEIRSYDFGFVPTIFAECLHDADIFMFSNMNSLGEMKNTVIEYWMNFIQQKTNVRHLFCLNRFLNRIDLDKHYSRLEENACSLLFDDRWNILDWEVDPDYERMPYYTTFATRNLLVIADRIAADQVNTAENARVSAALLENIAHEDWATRPYFDAWQLKFGGNYPNLMSRSDRELTPDLTMDGTLFKLWESIRLAPDKTNVEMIMNYLTVLSGTNNFFEEFFYYGSQLKAPDGGAS